MLHHEKLYNPLLAVYGVFMKTAFYINIKQLLLFFYSFFLSYKIMDTEKL